MAMPERVCAKRERICMCICAICKSLMYVITTNIRFCRFHEYCCDHVQIFRELRRLA